MIVYMYEQFSSRFGFNDGDDTPAWAEAYRNLLVDFLNRYFKGNNLEARAGSTGHNPVTLYWWDKENDCDSDHGPKGLEELLDLIENMDDDPFDLLIEVTVTVDPNADGMLDGLLDAVKIFEKVEEEE